MNPIDKIYRDNYAAGYQAGVRKIASAGGRASAIIDSIKGSVTQNPEAYIGGAAGAVGGAAIGAATGGRGKRIGRAILGAILGGGAGAGAGYGIGQMGGGGEGLDPSKVSPQAADPLGSGSAGFAEHYAKGGTNPGADVPPLPIGRGVAESPY